MNMIDNGVAEFISFEKVDDGEHLGFKVHYIDWYGKTCFDYVNTMSLLLRLIKNVKPIGWNRK